jgi:hypothetical protein
MRLEDEEKSPMMNELSEEDLIEEAVRSSGVPKAVATVTTTAAAPRNATANTTNHKAPPNPPPSQDPRVGVHEAKVQVQADPSKPRGPVPPTPPKVAP